MPNIFRFCYLFLALTIWILDYISKIIATQTLILTEPKKLTPFFNLTLIYNQGAAFGFLSEAGGWQRWFFLGLALLVSFILIVLIFKLKKASPLLLTSFSLLIAGALGNAYDRFMHGYVIDFIELHWKGWYWPSFNIADCAITLAVILLIFVTVHPSSRATTSNFK